MVLKTNFQLVRPPFVYAGGIRAALLALLIWSSLVAATARPQQRSGGAQGISVPNGVITTFP